MSMCVCTEVLSTITKVCQNRQTDFDHAQVGRSSLNDTEQLGRLCHIDGQGQIRLLALDELQELLC